MSTTWINSLSTVMIFLVFIVAFCFWFLYLLQNIIQKRNSYKVAMRNIQYDQNSVSVAYKAETELVKNTFLFIMNVVELLSIIIIIVPATFLTSTSDVGSNDTHVGFYILAKQSLTTNVVDTLNNKLLLYSNTLGIAVFILSLTLITSL